MTREVERRSGSDNRTKEQIEEQGERRVSEDRRAPRRRILKGVRISFGNEFCAVEGVMRNISDSGALVRLKDGFLVPDQICIHNELDGYKVACEVVRRHADLIGVRFIEAPVPIEAKKHQVVSIIGFNDAIPEEERDQATPEAEPARMPVGKVSRPGIARPSFGKLGNR